MSAEEPMKGSIQASCGHVLGDDEGENGFGFNTITLGDDCDFDGVYRCAFYGSACQKCYDRMKEKNMLVTHEEAERWIKTGELPERMQPRCRDCEHYRVGVLGEYCSHTNCAISGETFARAAKCGGKFEYR